VALELFADPVTRRAWITEKGLIVFTLWSPALPLTEIDIFVEEPFPFEEAYGRALRADLEFGIVTVASIDDLVEMKQRAGRAKDLEDIRALEQLKRSDPHG
jgi:hypothetical protein